MRMRCLLVAAEKRPETVFGTQKFPGKMLGLDDRDTSVVLFI